MARTESDSDTTYHRNHLLSLRNSHVPQAACQLLLIHIAADGQPAHEKPRLYHLISVNVVIKSHRLSFHTTLFTPREPLDLKGPFTLAIFAAILAAIFAAISSVISRRFQIARVNYWRFKSPLKSPV